MVLKYNDVSNIAKAYVEELAEFVDLAHTENKRILSKHDLI
jgi:hypothetical protein